jgi:hypothetical protein
MPDVDNSIAAATFSSTLYQGNTRHYMGITSCHPKLIKEKFSMVTQHSLNRTARLSLLIPFRKGIKKGGVLSLH